MLKCIDKGKKYLDINPFHATDLFWYPLKTSENQRFSDIFKGYQKRSVVLNRLRSCNISLEITVTWYLIGWPNVCTQSDPGKLWFRVKCFAKSSPCKLAYWALLLSNLFCVYYPRKFQVSSRIRRSGKWLSPQTPTLQNFQNTQTIRWLGPTNCLSMFDHFVGLAFIVAILLILKCIMFRQYFYGELG